jgi:hypothetical protein
MQVKRIRREMDEWRASGLYTDLETFTVRGMWVRANIIGLT